MNSTQVLVGAAVVAAAAVAVVYVMKNRPPGPPMVPAAPAPTPYVPPPAPYVPPAPAPYVPKPAPRPGGIDLGGIIKTGTNLFNSVKGLFDGIKSIF